MPLEHHHLDVRTRTFMTSEINGDLQAETLYFSDNLTEEGCANYPTLLLDAARNGDDSTLAESLLACLKSHEKPRKLASGGYSKPPIMRSNAHEMLAEGEFNRFYMRALCLRAMEEKIPELIVYRAKEVSNARSASEGMIGQHMSAEALLNDLRTNVGVDTALGLPPGPNSGLCVKLP